MRGLTDCLTQLLTTQVNRDDVVRNVWGVFVDYVQDCAPPPITVNTELVTNVGDDDQVVEVYLRATRTVNPSEELGYIYGVEYWIDWSLTILSACGRRDLADRIQIHACSDLLNRDNTAATDRLRDYLLRPRETGLKEPSPTRRLHEYRMFLTGRLHYMMSPDAPARNTLDYYLTPIIVGPRPHSVWAAGTRSDEATMRILKALAAAPAPTHLPLLIDGSVVVPLELVDILQQDADEIVFGKKNEGIVQTSTIKSWLAEMKKVQQ
jgi:hypothetical protein